MKGPYLLNVKIILILLVISLFVIYALFQGKLQNHFPIQARLAEQISKFNFMNQAQTVNQPKPVLATITEKLKEVEHLYNSTELNESIQKLLWTVHELQEFLSHEIITLNTLAKTDQQLKNRIYRFQQMTEDYTNVIASDLDKLDGKLHLKKLRKEKWRNVSSIMQSKIVRTQNPSNCSTSPKLCSALNIGDGLAAEMNMLLPCQVKSFYAGKPLLLDKRNWPYIQGSTWENYFQPYSLTCQDEPFISNCDITCDMEKEAFISLPEDLARDIKFLGLNPLAWLYGQFNGYILRPSARMLGVISLAKRKLGFVHPIVGLQVRKTDKIGTEAIDHSVEEYMLRANRFFNRLQIGSSEKIIRRVFLATDNPNVITDLRQKYPNYLFLNNPSASEAAKNRSTRYSLSALEDLIVDLYLLAQSDHIVCTFSSGVCRLAFELMQYLQPDSLLKSDSLDVPHHFVFSMAPNEKVIYDHSPVSKSEIPLRRGDHIKLAEGYYRIEATNGKLSDGLSLGTVQETQSSGYFPTFKVFPELLIRPYDFDNETLHMPTMGF